MQFWRPKGETFWKITVEMSGRDGASKEIVSLNEPDFLEHITHYKNCPIPGTPTAQFVYLDNPNEYENISAEFWDFLARRSKAIVASGNMGISSHLMQIVRLKMLEWISREGGIRVPSQRMPRLFVDTCLICVSENSVEITTLAREFLHIEDLTLLKESKTRSRVLLFSAFWLSQKYPTQNREKFLLELDPLFGFCLIDARNGELISFGIRTIRQCLAAYGKPWRNDVSLFIGEMLKESMSSGVARTILAPPALNANYAVATWITFACVNELFQRTLKPQQDCCVTIPEFFVLGYSGFPGEINSFDFSRRAQSAAVNLKLACSDEDLRYILRFDLSHAQPVLHVDFQIFCPGHTLDRKKLLAHAPISLDDLWRSNRTLYIGFLAAGGYDSYFDRLIERGLEGFHRISSENAAAGYPLIMRVLSKPEEDWLLANKRHLAALEKIANDGLKTLTSEEKSLIPELVSRKLFRDGGLTLLGEMLSTRLRP